MKKLIITSIAALAVMGTANASTYLNWDKYDAGTNPGGMAHIDAENPAPGAEHNFNLIQGAINNNAKEFDEVHQVIADWNDFLFGENHDMTDGLFYSYYRKDGGVQDRLAALENSDAADGVVADMAVGFGKLSHEISHASKELSAGIANVAALSAVATSDVKQGEVSFGGGYGYHNSQSAVAFGTAVGLTDNWSMNAGLGFNDYDVTVRAGTNVKFKLF